MKGLFATCSWIRPDIYVSITSKPSPRYVETANSFVHFWQKQTLVDKTLPGSFAGLLLPLRDERNVRICQQDDDVRALLHVKLFSLNPLGTSTKPNLVSLPITTILAWRTFPPCESIPASEYRKTRSCGKEHNFRRTANPERSECEGKRQLGLKKVKKPSSPQPASPLSLKRLHCMTWRSRLSISTTLLCEKKKNRFEVASRHCLDRTKDGGGHYPFHEYVRCTKQCYVIG